MSKITEARHLLAMQAHRKVAIQRLHEAREILEVLPRNPSMLTIFGTALDDDLAARLDDVVTELNALASALADRNKREAA